MMKKKYISPILEIVASHLKGQLMDHSYGWADAKGTIDNDSEDEEGKIQNSNLWDD